MARIGQATMISRLHFQEESGTTLEIATPQLSLASRKLLLERERKKKMHLMHSLLVCPTQETGDGYLQGWLIHGH